jgi:hypothetical protein
MSNYHKLTIHQAASFRYQGTLKNDDGTPVDITGASFRGEVRKTYSSAVIFSFSFQIIDAPNGIFEVTATDETTSALSENAIYDWFIDWSNGDSDMLMHGDVAVVKRVTQ